MAIREVADFSLTAALLAGFLQAAGTDARAVEPLAACATVPDLASLALAVGGPEVSLSVFTKGPQDPHFVEAKPSFLKALSRADLYLQVGLDLEAGWAPPLLRSARNPKVLPSGAGAAGTSGFLDASRDIARLEVPAGEVDRSRGDVHPFGNPHYLLDPLNGLRAAEQIAARLSELRPAARASFERRLEDFRRRLAAALLGEQLLERYGEEDVPKLLELLERGGWERFARFLESQGQKELVAGWLGLMEPHRGARVVADHNLWPYFARRFGVSVVGFLEPKPGIAPTTRHLAALIRTMRAEGVRAVLSVPYFNPRHASFVARETGARVVPMAHQVGSREGTESYLEMVDHNVRQLAGALGAGSGSDAPAEARSGTDGSAGERPRAPEDTRDARKPRDAPPRNR